MIKLKPQYLNGLITTPEEVVKVKRNLIILIVSAAILVFCLAMVAGASYHKISEPIIVEDTGTSISVDATTDLSGIKVVAERKERLDKLPSAPQAEINR